MPLQTQVKPSFTASLSPGGKAAAFPFSVVAPGHGEAFTSLGKIGFRAFHYLATGIATVNFPRGFIGEEFAHVALTVWAVSESVSKPSALRQLKTVAPGYVWSVVPAPAADDFKPKRPRTRFQEAAT